MIFIMRPHHDSQITLAACSGALRDDYVSVRAMLLLSCRVTGKAGIADETVTLCFNIALRLTLEP